MIDKIDPYVRTLFPWLFSHPSLIVLGGAAYSLLTTIMRAENARKAAAYDKKASLLELDHIDNTVIAYGWPLAAAAAIACIAFQRNAEPEAAIFISIVAGGIFACALRPLTLFSNVDSRSRIAYLSVIALVFLLIFSYFYGEYRAEGKGWEYIRATVAMIVSIACPLSVLYIIILKLYNIINKHVEWIVLLSSLLSVAMFFIFAYILGGFAWNEILNNM